MTVGRVDVLAQPDAGVGEPEAGSPQPLVEQCGGAGGGPIALLKPQGRTVGEGQLVEKRLGEAVVVVAWYEDRLAVAQRLAQLLEKGSRNSQGETERPLAQLDHVAEQDYAVSCGDLLEKRPADLRTA